MASAKKDNKPFSPKKKDFPRKDSRPDFKNKNEEASSPKKRRRIRLETAEKMPLNKFLAHSGVGSRKEAVSKIKDGLVTVNEEVVTNPAMQVSTDDTITYKGAEIKPKNKLAYLLVNKPKGMGIGRMDSEKRDVYTIIEDGSEEPVFPVGGLPKKYAGLLLMSNDGDLTEALGNPNNQVEQLYKVSLDKAITEEDLAKIRDGKLEIDVELHLLDIQYASEENKREVGIHLKNNQAKILDKIFGAVGYQIEYADRVIFAGLSKKNISRGFYRRLKSTEIVKLKHFNNYSEQ